MRVDPRAEFARLEGVLEQENRRALHRPRDHRRLGAAALGDEAHAAIVAGDQRPLGGRHRNVKFALRALAVDAQRPGEPDRHLRRADEILDIARKAFRIERVAADMVEARFGSRLDKGPALGGRFGRIVVGAVSRNAGRGVGGHGTRLPVSAWRGAG